MKKYTIGALFTPDMTKVLLIKKVRPAWQAGRHNLPGGHIEEGETCQQCVSREFNEEAGASVPPEEWKHIGKIENDGNYFVDYLTAIYDPVKHGPVESKTEEAVSWEYCTELPETVISNLHWLVPFAMNTVLQGNGDNLIFGNFSYAY